ncbi:MAG: tetratricopeptide repeat protein, partial [Xanthobacteraceae bacterium]
MTDIFNEVDEEVRREQLNKLWERYGIYLVALCVLIVAGVGAWRGYEWWQSQQAAKSGAAFEQAVALAQAGKH